MYLFTREYYQRKYRQEHGKAVTIAPGMWVWFRRDYMHKGIVFEEGFVVEITSINPDRLSLFTGLCITNNQKIEGSLLDFPLSPSIVTSQRKRNLIYEYERKQTRLAPSG